MYVCFLQFFPAVFLLFWEEGKVANDAEIDHEIEHLMLVLEMRDA